VTLPPYLHKNRVKNRFVTICYGFRNQAGQSEIIKEVKAIREQTEHLTEFEAKTDLNFRKTFEEINTMKRVTKDNLYDIADLKTRAM
jgi:hypothetical protein